MNEQTIDRLIELDEVMSQAGMKKTKLYAEIKAGRFPAPVKLGSLSRWSERKVQAWVSQQTEQAAA
ncbi:helix-turn-helix transcriptional regulator [Methyloversatilis sp.]|uniref:helix-turn-helix transcriptional regulator n=1 Tax=Methyloversatilis sp. TaxID=2569862 RepID=UPI003D2A72AB